MVQINIKDTNEEFNLFIRQLVYLCYKYYFTDTRPKVSKFKEARDKILTTNRSIKAVIKRRTLESFSFVIERDGEKFEFTDIDITIVIYLFSYLAGVRVNKYKNIYVGPGQIINAKYIEVEFERVNDYWNIMLKIIKINNKITKEKAYI